MVEELLLQSTSIHLKIIFLYIITFVTPLMGVTSYWSVEDKNINNLNDESLLEHNRYLIKYLETHSVPKSNIKPALNKLDLLLVLKELERAIIYNDFENIYFLNLRDSPKSLMTGYYTPIFDASLEKNELYKYPLYRPPSDLMSNAHLYQRLDIDYKGLLKDKNLEIVWLRSKLDNFLVHVQGSASLQLNSGELIKVAYAGSNKKEYTSIGKLLIENNKISKDEISLQKIREYFIENPSELDQYLLRNKRYIFFQKSKSSALGSMGAKVSALKSIATEKYDDGSYKYPPFIPFYIEFNKNIPNTNINQLIVFNQDTGSAIKGDLRMDLYTGIGLKAEKIAGELIENPEVYILWPKKIELPEEISGYKVIKEEVIEK